MLRFGLQKMAVVIQQTFDHCRNMSELFIFYALSML